MKKLLTILETVMLEFESLLSDDAMHDPEVWGRAFTVGDSSDPKAPLCKYVRIGDAGGRGEPTRGGGSKGLTSQKHYHFPSIHYT